MEFLTGKRKYLLKIRHANRQRHVLEDSDMHLTTSDVAIAVSIQTFIVYTLHNDAKNNSIGILPFIKSNREILCSFNAAAENMAVVVVC